MNIFPHPQVRVRLLAGCSTVNNPPSERDKQRKEFRPYLTRKHATLGRKFGGGKTETFRDQITEVM